MKYLILLLLLTGCATSNTARIERLEKRMDFLDVELTACHDSGHHIRKFPGYGDFCPDANVALCPKQSQ